MKGYFETGASKCEKCDISCKECTKKGNECVECADDFEKKDGKCKPKCGKYLDDKNTLKECDENCKCCDGPK